jgi:predicted nucleic acid-binding protein
MIIYIIDTNLVFSATLNPTSQIAKFIFNKEDYDIELIAPTFLKEEMSRHFDRLAELKKTPAKIVSRTLDYVYKQINFVKDKDIPIPHYSRAAELIREIDDDDLNFVALNISKDEYLLTGNVELYNGLPGKGYHKVITFQQLKEKHNIQ